MKVRVLVLATACLCAGCPSKSKDSDDAQPSPAAAAEEKTYPARQLDRARTEADAATKALEARNANIDAASSNQ